MLLTAAAAALLAMQGTVIPKYAVDLLTTSSTCEYSSLIAAE